MGELFAFLVFVAVVLWILVWRPLAAAWEGVRDARWRAKHVPTTSFPPRKGSTARRCPYCHDDLERGDGVVCNGCLAHHHPDCHDEHGACAACGAEGLLGLEGRRRNHPLEREREA